MILGGEFLLYRGIRGYCPVYRALERSLGIPLTDGLSFEESITVNKPVEQVYALWRQVDNLYALHVQYQNSSSDCGQSLIDLLKWSGSCGFSGYTPYHPHRGKQENLVVSFLGQIFPSSPSGFSDN